MRYLVMDPASLQVSRHARRVKTDHIDVEKLLHTLIAWCRGERHVCSIVVIPSIEEEDQRRSHRERDRLVRERTAHINRIKGLLFAHGIRGMPVHDENCGYDGLCATVVGSRREPSGEFQIKRSNSLAIATTIVDLGENITWE